MIGELRRHGGRAHIAALRRQLQWREWGMGDLARFLRKYCGWFALDGDAVRLLAPRAADAAVAAGSLGGDDGSGGDGGAAGGCGVRWEGMGAVSLRAPVAG